MATNNIYAEFDMNDNGIHKLADAAADQDAVTYKQLKAVIDSMIKKVTSSIGDGESTNFSITHNLNTQNVIVQIRENNTPYNFVTANIQTTDVNSVAISFTSVPTVNQYTVIILG